MVRPLVSPGRTLALVFEYRFIRAFRAKWTPRPRVKRPADNTVNLKSCTFDVIFHLL